MKNKLNISWLAATVTVIGLLATGCPTDAGNGADPELRGIVTIDFAAPLGVGTVVTAGVMNLTAGGNIYFQWQRGTYPDFTDIGEPTTGGNTRTITDEDISRQIRVVVTRVGTTGQIESNHIGPVPVVPSLEGIVKIDHDGVLTVDTLLTATASDLTAGGAIYFQWQRGTYPNFTDIGGPMVNGNTHTVTNADVDHHIRVVVTRAGTTGQIESGCVGPVNAPRRLVADQIADLRVGVPPAEVTVRTGIANERIAPQTLAFGGRQITITLTRGYPGDTLYLGSLGTMFTVGSGVTLILEGIELRGITNNNNVLVAVQNGGALVMNADARIAGNVNTNQSDANQGGGVRIGSGGSFTMEDGEISDNTGLFGGGVLNMGTFTMDGGKISGNTAGRYGGGVDNMGAFTMGGGKISGNVARDGGGVLNMGTFTMDGGKISGNTAERFGAGVDNIGTFTMGGGKISENTAPLGSGVTNHFGFTFTMRNGEISGNTAMDGGGVANAGIFRMHDGAIYGNDAAVTGGGVLNNNTFTMEGGTISGNTALTGSGVLNSRMLGSDINSIFTMYDGKIHGNIATMDGGGVATVGPFIMRNGVISGNTAGRGGGGVINFDVFDMHDGAISGNTARDFGGGVFNSEHGTVFNMHSGEISGNTSEKDGAGVYNQSIFNMRDGKISDNTARDFGGGVFNNGTFAMHNGEIFGNTASLSGGGVENLGIFDMLDGGIFGNAAGRHGGGVLNLGVGTTFNMRGGEITGNAAEYGGGVINVSGVFRISDGIVLGADAPTGGNTAYIGAALLEAVLVVLDISPVSQYGLFGNGGFIANGDLTSTDLTIEVVDGQRITPTRSLGFSESLDGSLPVTLDLSADRRMRPETRLLPEFPGTCEFGRVFERLR